MGLANMSVHVISWVLKHSEAKGSDRLVLIALADKASDDGTHAYPSVDTLARESRCSRRTVQSSLRKLEADGRLVCEGLGPRGQNRYVVIMGGAQDSHPITDHDAGGAEVAPGGRRSRPKGGAEVAPEPSIEPSIEPSDLSSIFDHWRRAMAKPGAKFTAGRKRAIRARLREGYTAADLKRAIDGCAASGFHRDGGHDDLTLICRNGEKVERFLGFADGGAAGQSNNGRDGPTGPELRELAAKLRAEGK